MEERERGRDKKMEERERNEIRRWRRERGKR